MHFVCATDVFEPPAQVQQALQQHGQDMQNLWGKDTSGL